MGNSNLHKSTALQGHIVGRFSELQLRYVPGIPGPKGAGDTNDCCIKRTNKIVPFCNDRESHNSISPPPPPPPQKKKKKLNHNNENDKNNNNNNNFNYIQFPETHHKAEILEKKIRAKMVRAYEYLIISEYSLPWGLFRFICIISTRNIAWN